MEEFNENKSTQFFVVVIYKSKKEISAGIINFKLLKIEKLVMSKKQNMPVLRLPSAIEQQNQFSSYLKMVKLHM